MDTVYEEIKAVKSAQKGKKARPSKRPSVNESNEMDTSMATTSYAGAAASTSNPE